MVTRWSQESYSFLPPLKRLNMFSTVPSGHYPQTKNTLPSAPEEALEFRRTTPIQRLILVILPRHVGPNGFCDVSQQKLADETGLSRAAVNRNRKGLEAFGLIESRQIPGKNLKRYGLSSGQIPSPLSKTSGGLVPALKSGRSINPATLDTPIPEGLLERRQSYETLLLMRTYTRSPITRLLLRSRKRGWTCRAAYQKKERKSCPEMPFDWPGSRKR